MADAVLKALHRLIVHAEEGLGRALLGRIVLQAPDAVAVGEALRSHADLWQDADLRQAWCYRAFIGCAAASACGNTGKRLHLKAGHGEEEVGVVPRVDGDKGVVPVQRGEAARQAVLHVPEDGPPEVDIVLHEPHARVAGPALFVVVAHDVLVVGVWVLCQVALHQVFGLVRREAEQHVHLHVVDCQARTL